MKDYTCTIDDCPECNESFENQFLYARQYGSNHDQQPMHRDGPEGRHTPVHDRLGKRVDPQEQLEGEANARVPNEPSARDPEVQDVRRPSVSINQWCPSGLIHSQKKKTAEAAQSGKRRASSRA